MEPRYKMYPPLRPAADVAALREALLEGLIDAVATDHAPHSAFETEVTFEEAPRGVIGLETAAAAVNTAVGMGAEDFFARMSIQPALIGGFGRQGQLVSEGSAANLVIFDPDGVLDPDRVRLEGPELAVSGHGVARPRHGDDLRGTHDLRCPMTSAPPT